jgi:hypothetical protein
MENLTEERSIASDSHFMEGEMKSSSYSPGAVSSFVRAAEDCLSMGNLSQAMEQLSQARKLEPNNEVVRTIMEKVRTLQETEKRGSLRKGLSGSDAGLESGRFLSVTVGKQFERGIRGEGEEPQESQDDVQMRVQELTETAQILLNRGLRESAFDALMKAYILDPLSPEVISCEKRVLPLWEQGHQQETGLTASPEADRRTVKRESLLGQIGEKGGAGSHPTKETLFGPAKKR